MNILSKFINVVINPVGAACNIQCSYCYIKTNDSVNAGRLRLGTIIKFVDTLNSIEDLEYVNFTWHGGEPFLYPIESYKAIFEYIDKNFSKKYCHVFQTNGTLITDDWIKLFSEYFVSIGISVDGADYESNKARFSDEKIYKKMIPNLDLVLNSNLYTSIFITLGRHNIDKIDEIFKFIEEKKPNGFYINPIKKKIGNELSVNEWLEIIEKMDEFSKRTGIENSLTPQIQRAINGEIPSLCMLNGACNKFINMNVDGEIFKTCVFQSQSNYLGNIDEDNIKNKIIEYIDHIQIPSLDSFYNRLSKDDRFIYMQGDGCSNFRGSNNNSVYVNGIIEYIKNIIQ